MNDPKHLTDEERAWLARSQELVQHLLAMRQPPDRPTMMEVEQTNLSKALIRLSDLRAQVARLEERNAVNISVIDNYIQLEVRYQAIIAAKDAALRSLEDNPTCIHCRNNQEKAAAALSDSGEGWLPPEERERHRQILQGLYDYTVELEKGMATWVMSRPSMASYPPGALELGKYVRAALAALEVSKPRFKDDACSEHPDGCPEGSHRAALEGTDG